MIRNLLATTALSMLVATGAYSQTSVAPAPAERSATDTDMVNTDAHLASDMMGRAVFNGTGEDAETIGRVSDMVLADDGTVESVVVGVGGFLGVGDKEVAIEYQMVEWSGNEKDRRLVVKTTKEELEKLQEFDAARYGSPQADTQSYGTGPAPDQNVGAAPAKGEEESASAGDETGKTDRMQTSSVERPGLKEMKASDISSEEFVGTKVYGANDENIGEIGDVILTQNGTVEAVIVDVGGFLEVGEKQVAISMENLSFMTDQNGDYFLYTGFTREQLEGQPAYNEAIFAENRGEQLLSAPTH